MPNKIFVVPDTQVRAGVPTEHIKAIARYIVHLKPDTIVCIGDWWDMPALSVFNTKLMASGLRLKEDLDAGKEAMLDFMHIIAVERERIQRNKKKRWNPRFIFTVGNHDPQVRIPRYVEAHPELEGWMQDNTSEWLRGLGWEVYEFLEIATDSGISFSHYFQNMWSAKKSPIGGTIETMIKNVGFSFVQGHTQCLKLGKQQLGNGQQRIGVVAGSCYKHTETYMGTQGNNHWRGCIVLNEAHEGGADIMEVSLSYIERKYG